VWEENWADFDRFIARPETDIEYDPDQKVYELIDNTSMEWKFEVIKKFSQQGADNILSMPFKHPSY